MIVQWCCKGIAKLPLLEAEGILRDGVGIRCRNWLSNPLGMFSLNEALHLLTECNLHRHVNGYASAGPDGVPFYQRTPFISLSAGCVDRDTTAKTNRTHRAFRTALEFATTDYASPANPRCQGWIFYCYVIVGTNPAVSVPSVAEEIRELNHGRAYSGWYWQGEVAAKINVPSTQILCAEEWEPVVGNELQLKSLLVNLAFTHPSQLVNERGML